MKNFIKHLFLAVVTTLSFTLLYSQDDIKLQIVRGKSDTVYSPIHYVVGVAEKGAVIYVNDIKVKQYTTGSFGAELILNPGENDVEVRAVSGGYEYKEFFSVYLKEREAEEQSVDAGLFSKPVIVTKKGAYLNYGAGQDRLGGAKINFLAEGVKMEVLGIEGSLYKVKLSDNRYAYIPRQFAEILPIGTEPPFSLSSSWSVVNYGDSDIIRVALEDKQPYVIYRDMEPNRLVVDIHGVACNSNWITQYLNLKSVDYVYLQQKESDVLSVIIHFKDKYSWGYSVDYQGNSLVISIKNTPDVLYEKHKSREPFKGLYIGVDAGHGGSASGAVSPSGIKEKDINLDMALILRNELEKLGAKVVLSRSEDVDISMKERADMFKEENVDMVVSVHCNAGGNPLRTMGTSTYYKHIEYRNLAETILKRLLENGVDNFGLVGNFNFSLNAPTEFPSVLVETLFMSSLPEEEMLADPGFRKEMMLKVVKGLEDYIDKVRNSLK